MNNLKRSTLAIILFLSVLVNCICAGCGGGSSSAGGGGGGGGDSRALLLDSITAKCATFDGTDMDNENQQMLAFLQTKPAFVETGRSKDGAWGKLSDGTTLAICNNVNATAETRQARSTIVSSPRSRAGGLPSSGNVVLGTSLGSFFESFIEPFVPALFLTQSYTRVQPDSSVDALKNLNDVAVLHLFGHAGLFDFRKPGPKVLAVWTSTLRARDGSTDTKYAADIADGSLIWFTSLAYHTDPNIKVKKVWETHYAITAKFVTKYWTGKFNKNSLVFINSCNSANLDALDFDFACLTAGASYFVGWSDRMRLGEAVSTASYLFDRLLGSNTDAMGANAKETPPQRAFSIGPVLAEMTTRMRTGAGYAFDTTVPDPEKKGDAPVQAKLRFFTTNSEFQQLAPSIESLDVNEQKDELYINGTFGSGKGNVSMNGSNMTVKTWTANQITCTLPRSGANASGDVSVIADVPRQVSNTVQLTEWKGTVTCTFKSKGSMTSTMNFNVHFRADVHDRRIQPHETPFTLGSGYLNALDTSGTYVVSGNYTSPDGLYKEDWTGSGSIPAFIKPPAGTSPPEVTNVVVQGGFDETRQWSMAIRAIAKGGNQIHTVLHDTQGKLVYDKTETTDAVWLSLDDLNGNINLVTAGPTYNISGGTKTHTVNSEESLSLVWSAMSAIHPPDPAAARSAKLPSKLRTH